MVKWLALPSAHARVANEGLGLQTTKNLLGTSELNWAAVTGAGVCSPHAGIPSVLQSASTPANPNRNGGEAFGVRTTWGWVQ